MLFYCISIVSNGAWQEEKSHNSSHEVVSFKGEDRKLFRDYIVLFTHLLALEDCTQQPLYREFINR